jgi:hypothetical protein
MSRPKRKQRKQDAPRAFHDETAGERPPRRGKHSPDAILVNQLTVGSAVHLVKTEGGSLSVAGIAMRACGVFLVAAFTARAIVVGDATVWHLFLPIAAEWLVLVLALPILRLFVDDEGLRADARRAFGWIVVLTAGGALWIGSRSFDEGSAWTAQALVELERLRDWIVGRKMLWPIVAAAAAMALSLPGRVASFRRHGPPFLAVGVGCAMRIVVALFGCFLLPIVVQSPGRITWAIWGVLLVSELTALAMHWDLQRRLARRGIEV